MRARAVFSGIGQSLPLLVFVFVRDAIYLRVRTLLT